MLRKTSWPRGWILEPAGREQLPCALRRLASVNKCQVSMALQNGGIVLSTICITCRDVKTTYLVH